MESSYWIVGIVVNPKLKKPVLVVWDGSEISIWSMEKNGRRIGLGSYEAYEEQYLKPSLVTGMPRVHTPSGVSMKKQGYGTSLYTALCLGAHQHHDGDLDIEVPYEGDGICSDRESRSADASKWWEMAVRLDLADVMEDEAIEEDVEFDADDLECTHYSGQNVQVHWARGDVSEMIMAYFYEFDSADSADLVVAGWEPIKIREGALEEVSGEGAGYWQSTTPFMVSSVARGRRYSSIAPEGFRNVWRMLAEEDDAEYVNNDALLALDMRNMEPHAVNLLSTVARINGVDDELIISMRMRAEYQLDPDASIKQMSLPFKPNSSEGRAIMQELERTKELRASLDWDRLSALP